VVLGQSSRYARNQARVSGYNTELIIVCRLWAAGALGMCLWACGCLDAGTKDTSVGSPQATVKGGARSFRLHVALLPDKSPIHDLAFSPDGRVIATCSSGEALVRFWSTAQGHLTGTANVGPVGVSSVVYSPDGRLVATGVSRPVKVWDARTRKLRAVCPRQAFVQSFAFAPGGRILAAGYIDGLVVLWDAWTGTQRKVLRGHTDQVMAVAFLPDGRTLATAGWDPAARLWNIETGTLKLLLKGHTKGLWTLAVSPDGSTIATAGEDREVRLWDPATGQSRGRLRGHLANITQSAFTPDGRTLVTASWDNTTRLWDVPGAKQIGTIADAGHSLAISPSGRLLATRGPEFSVTVWDLKPLTCIARLMGHTAAVGKLAFSPDGKLLATSADDGKVLLWSVPPTQ
jgi:WD40 repeat protein